MSCRVKQVTQTTTASEKEAKEKFEKGLAPARARLSMKNFVDQAKEERKPGNQQIKEDTEKSDDEGR